MFKERRGKEKGLYELVVAVYMTAAWPWFEYVF